MSSLLIVKNQLPNNFFINDVSNCEVILIKSVLKIERSYLQLQLWDRFTRNIDPFPVISDIADGVNHVRRAAVFWRAPTRVPVIETFLFPATRAFRLVLSRGWEGVKETFTRATSARREKPVADREFSHGGTARRWTIARINFLRRLRLPRCRCSHAD